MGVYWSRADEQLFPDDAEMALVTVTVDPADSDPAADLLLDPLPHLVKNIDEVEPDWTVTFGRVNAEVAVRKGPRKLVGIWTVISAQKHVHGVVYRVPG